jgi:pimeloyl-ACP methyl ester carboxylesterase
MAALFFNNRGAHIAKSFKVPKGRKSSRLWQGMAYEKIRDCVYDIEAGIDFLESEGFEEIHLAGFSTGANKICVYDHYKKRNRIAKYVILCGGDDVGIYYQMLGKRIFFKLLAKAKNRIRFDKDMEIMPDLLRYGEIFSNAGFYDIANPDGDYNVFPFIEIFKKKKLSTLPLFRYFGAIKKPSMVIYGENDEFLSGGDGHGATEVLKRYQSEFDYRIIRRSDHAFKGHESEVGKTMAEWLK